MKDKKNKPDLSFSSITAHIHSAKVRKNTIIMSALPLILTLSACGSDDSSQAKQNELKAVVAPSNHISTTGKIRLDLADSVYDSLDSVFHSITVTDDNQQIVYQIDDVPAEKIKNQIVDFSPLPHDVVVEKPTSLKRTFTIHHSIRHKDGRVDQTSKQLTIDEFIIVGDVSGHTGDVPLTPPDGILAATTLSETEGCITTCTVTTAAMVSCALPATLGCTTVQLDDLKNLVNPMIAESPMVSNSVTPSTPFWIQTGGGYGGPHNFGGHGGFAQTATTTDDITSESGVSELHYYIGQGGFTEIGYDNVSVATGGGSTIVTRTAITDGFDVSDISQFLVIAGGGGAGGAKWSGGDGGWAYAPNPNTPSTYSSGVGSESVHGGKGGGTPFYGDDGDPDTLSASGGKGGNKGARGKDGFGGEAGNSHSGLRVGWLNADSGAVAGPLQGQGKGGSNFIKKEPYLPGGGGGFGGGGSGPDPTTKSLGGGGGGGSYAIAAAFNDPYAPTDQDELHYLGPISLKSDGWLRIVFNTRLVNQSICEQSVNQQVVCQFPDSKTSINLQTLFEQARLINPNILETTPLWIQARGGQGGNGNGVTVNKGLGGPGGVAQTVTTLHDLKSLIDVSSNTLNSNTKGHRLFYYLGKQGEQHFAGNGGASTIVSFVSLNGNENHTTPPCLNELKSPDLTQCDSPSNIYLLAGGGGGAGSGEQSSHGGAGGIALANGSPPTSFIPWGGTDGANPTDDEACNGKGGYGAIPGNGSNPGTGDIGGKGGISHGSDTQTSWRVLSDLYGVSRDSEGQILNYGAGGTGSRQQHHNYSGGGGGGGWGGGGGGRAVDAKGCGGGGGGSYAWPPTIQGTDAPTQVSGHLGYGRVVVTFSPQ